MPRLRISPELKALLAYGMVIFSVPLSVSAAPEQIPQIGGVIIPQAFSQALQDGMSIPLFIHLEGSTGNGDDQRSAAPLSGWMAACCACARSAWRRAIIMPP
nr:putative enzyme [Raoultella sp. NCTC 9187]